MVHMKSEKEIRRCGNCVHCEGIEGQNEKAGCSKHLKIVQRNGEACTEYLQLTPKEVLMLQKIMDFILGNDQEGDTDAEEE